MQNLEEKTLEVFLKLKVGIAGFEVANLVVKNPRDNSDEIEYPNATIKSIAEGVGVLIVKFIPYGSNKEHVSFFRTDRDNSWWVQVELIKIELFN